MPALHLHVSNLIDLEPRSLLYLTAHFIKMMINFIICWNLFKTHLSQNDNNGYSWFCLQALKTRLYSHF